LAGRENRRSGRFPRVLRGSFYPLDTTTYRELLQRMTQNQLPGGGVPVNILSFTKTGTPHLVTGSR
jgi:hypothetical protein